MEFRLEGVDEVLWWGKNKSNMPASIQIGDIIRGFYENTSENVIYLDAYEKYDEDGQVLMRAGGGFSLDIRYCFED